MREIMLLWELCDSVETTIDGRIRKQSVFFQGLLLGIITVRQGEGYSLQVAFWFQHSFAVFLRAKRILESRVMYFDSDWKMITQLAREKYLIPKVHRKIRENRFWKSEVDCL